MQATEPTGSGLANLKNTIIMHHRGQVSHNPQSDAVAAIPAGTAGTITSFATMAPIAAGANFRAAFSSTEAAVQAKVSQAPNSSCTSGSPIAGHECAA